MEENWAVDAYGVMTPDVADEIKCFVAVGGGESAKRGFGTGGAGGGDKDLGDVGVSAVSFA